MRDPEVLVIGGGPAGLSAATELARAGHAVCLIEQRDTIGGAVYRQPAPGVEPIAIASATKARWLGIADAFLAARVTVRHGCVFLGLDGDGFILIEDRNIGGVERIRARAIIIATGAVEKVLPRPGWQLAGVSTAGGLQVMMKETGRVPQGRVLLAGSGPLLVAVAAQMARSGNPPVAVIEAGDPFTRFQSGLAMLEHGELLREAAGYLTTMMAKRIPWMRAARLVAIEKQGEGLQAIVRKRDGALSTILVDRIGLHDGIRENNVGLPAEMTKPGAVPIVLRAGDCREALGAIAAVADGRRAGCVVADLLSGRRDRADLEGDIVRARAAQATLSALFAPVDPASPLSNLPDDTILCRCEGKTVGDLRQLCDRADKLSGREVKHNGRFAMGACQGRFCAANTAALMAELNRDVPNAAAEDLTGRRWPIRPVSIAALTGAASKNTENE